MLNNIKYFFNYMYMYISKFSMQFIMYINMNKMKTLLSNYSLIYISNLFMMFLMDFFYYDDEPLWEPVEWSAVQTWVLFAWLFSWIAETMMVSYYGSFTGSDKSVYMGLYKTYCYMEFWLWLNLFLMGMFVVTPFYFEFTYNVSYMISWWNFYNSAFFVKFLMLWIFVEMITTLLKQSLKWINWKKMFMLVLFMNFMLIYLLYMQTMIVFFSYFTDILWYKKSGWCDYSGLSHFPQKWGWGDSNSDLFYYHKTTLNFWFKNNSLFASFLFFFNFFNFFYLFFLEMQWLLLLKKMYSHKTMSYTLLTYGVSSLNFYFLTMMLLFLFMMLTYIYQFMSYSYDFYWLNFLLDFILIFNMNMKFFFNFFM